MLKGKVLLKPYRLLTYIIRTLSDILKVFYLILDKVCTSVSNFSSGQHRHKCRSRHLLAYTQKTGTCAVSVTCSRYLRFIFSWSAVDLCVRAGQLSGQPSFDLHYCISSQVDSYPDIPDMKPNSLFLFEQSLGSESKKGHTWKELRYVSEYPAFYYRKDCSSTNHYSAVCLWVPPQLLGHGMRKWQGQSRAALLVPSLSSPSTAAFLQWHLRHKWDYGRSVWVGIG